MMKRNAKRFERRLAELEREQEVAEALVPAYCQRAPEP